MYEKGFTYLFEADHEMLLYGVLKKLHITPAAPLYEDLLQEARIIYAQAYEDYYKTPKKIKLNVYLYQKVKWRLIDLLRKEIKAKDKETVVADEVLKEKCDVSELGEENFVQQELFLELYKKCRPLEKECLKLLVFEGKNPTEVALSLGVSRRTIYNIRKKLQIKYKEL